MRCSVIGAIGGGALRTYYSISRSKSNHCLTRLSFKWKLRLTALHLHSNWGSNKNCALKDWRGAGAQEPTTKIWASPARSDLLCHASAGLRPQAPGLRCSTLRNFVVFNRLKFSYNIHCLFTSVMVAEVSKFIKFSGNLPSVKTRTHFIGAFFTNLQFYWLNDFIYKLVAVYIIAFCSALCYKKCCKIISHKFCSCKKCVKDTPDTFFAFGNSLTRDIGIGRITLLHRRESMCKFGRNVIEVKGHLAAGIRVASSTCR